MKRLTLLVFILLFAFGCNRYYADGYFSERRYESSKDTDDDYYDVQEEAAEAADTTVADDTAETDEYADTDEYSSYDDYDDGYGRTRVSIHFGISNRPYYYRPGYYSGVSVYYDYDPSYYDDLYWWNDCYGYRNYWSSWGYYDTYAWGWGYYWPYRPVIYYSPARYGNWGYNYGYRPYRYGVSRTRFKYGGWYDNHRDHYRTKFTSASVLTHSSAYRTKTHTPGRADSPYRTKAVDKRQVNRSRSDVNVSKKAGYTGRSTSRSRSSGTLNKRADRYRSKTGTRPSLQNRTQKKTTKKSNTSVNRHRSTRQSRTVKSKSRTSSRQSILNRIQRNTKKSGYRSKSKTSNNKSRTLRSIKPYRKPNSSTRKSSSSVRRSTPTRRTTPPAVRRSNPVIKRSTPARRSSGSSTKKSSSGARKRKR